ncbi:hypothetical protein OLM94_09635 [Pseudomonas aeruginosa]|uniref:Tse2 family ADP-ribosyltransferase toxin n=1 Tax=Pseudomonas aeruginosa TaxID=287 RepID=UPI00249820FD|nr:hypothetical protein [Pseudomonas aeruginosa]MDI2533676.1 hypothetical protein [Pseudomonas aeruginosa]
MSYDYEKTSLTLYRAVFKANYDGTDIPPDLKVKQDSYNKRLQATHYTIMPAKPMYREVLMGQLDNFVRNAIRRQWEKARGL